MSDCKIWPEVSQYVNLKVSFAIILGMTHLTNSDVLNLAKLAKVSLQPDEVESLKKDLGEILSFVEQLNDLDTTGLEPTHQVTGLTNVTRSDTILDYGIKRQAILDNVPKVQDDYIKVQKVL